MGFMTTITILNDHFHNLEKHPELLMADIRKGMNHTAVEAQQAFHFGQTMIHPAHHADVMGLYFTQYNSSTPLDRYSVKRLVESDGFYSTERGRRELERMANAALREIKAVKAILKS